MPMKTWLRVLVGVALVGCGPTFVGRTGKEMLLERSLIGLRSSLYFGTVATDVPRTSDPQGIIGGELVMCPPEFPWQCDGYLCPRRCPPVMVKITNDPKDEEAWATETRATYSPRSRNPGLPFGIAFLSRERCEAFRAEHPTYTKPHEVCERVYFRRLS